MVVRYRRRLLVTALGAAVALAFNALPARGDGAVSAGDSLPDAIGGTDGMAARRIEGRMPSGWLGQPVPDAWQYTENVSQVLPTDDKWWLQFDDAVLDSLIYRAETRNYNLASALRRIESARQSLRAAKAAYYPDVTLSGSWEAERVSGATVRPGVPASRSSAFDLGLQMSWEIDVFGRVRDNVRAQQAEVDATRAEYAAAMVSLCAEVAKTYINLRMYQEQLAVADAHQESQQKVVNIAKARQEAGIGNALDVAQALTVLYSTRASVPAAEALLETSVNSLATLTGSYPDEIRGLLGSGSERMPRNPGNIAAGVPADLLRRRPDIVEAEAEMAQAAALCGVAKKDFLPTLSLDATAGTTARNAGDMFSGPSLGWSVRPSLSWTVFDGLARNARSAEARANFEATVDSYNETVLNAVQEVDNAMASYSAGLRAIALRRDVIEQSRKSFDLSLDLYKQGLTQFSNVADAMMSLLENQNSLISSEGSLLNSYISLYEALGGGF